MTDVDINSIESTKVDLSGVHFQYVKDKQNMMKISEMLRKPILRFKSEERNVRRYYVIDGTTAYIYEE
jgi:hypothetical protein